MFDLAVSNTNALRERFPQGDPYIHIKAVTKHPVREKTNTGGRNLKMLSPADFSAMISLSFENLRKESSTPIMIDIGMTKTRKEGIEQINIRRTEETLTP
jgi:hypothetical protein